VHPIDLAARLAVPSFLLMSPHNDFIMQLSHRLKEALSQGERKLAAIMFTDMVGYTAQTQKNELLAMELLAEHNALLRPIFPKFGGREVKTIGDSFLVEFSSALEAVRCSVAIQEYLHDRNQGLLTERSIQLRVGVHIGDVINSGGDIIGDAVNISSRIEPLAEPGGVCISEQVYDQVRNKFELPLVSLGDKSLKNVSGKLEVYRVLMPWEGKGRSPEVGADKNRIAVLPFTNMSPDPQDEYFADGMTEELISTISGIGELSVISRTSVMRFKGTNKSIEEIGRELKVGALLEGSVRKAENMIRVTAQLIDVDSDRHLWAKSYDRELRGIFAIQSDIASKIAEALRVRLVPGREPARKHAENIEAYTLYLKGRSLWNKRDREGVLGSLKMFEKATKIDPDYARAYAGLADAYYIAATYGFMDRADGLAKSKEVATKALDLDEMLAEAHASLGINLLDDLRYEEAQREFQRAVELNPSYATAHHWFCMCLREMGRMKEAMEEIEKARELDPLSPVITDNVGETNLLIGRLDEAIATYDKLAENEPSFAPSFTYRAYCFALKGMKERAYADLETWHRLRRDEDGYKSNLAIFYGWFGERERAIPIIEELIPKVGESSVWEGDIASCYATIGNTDEFFNWIDRAISAKRISSQRGVFSVAGLRSLPLYDKVREDRRFPEIFKKLGLPY